MHVPALPMDVSKLSRLRAWQRPLGVLLGLSCLAWVALAVVPDAGGWMALEAMHPREVAIAATLFSLHLLLNAWAFKSLLFALGANRLKGGYVVAHAGTAIGKYLPGSVGMLLGRWFVLSRLGVPARTVWAASLTEQCGSLLICMGMGVATMLIVRGQDGVILGVAVLASILAATAVIAAVIAWAIMKGESARPARFIVYAALSLVSIGVFAIAHVVLASGADPSPAVVVPAILFSTAGGMLVFVVPGGLGIREAIASALLAESGPSVAWLIVARVVIIATELVAMLVSLGMSWRKR